MKRTLYITVAVLLMMHASVGLAGVADTKHNLSSGGTGTYTSATENEVCKFCHTPHSAIANTPLWDHKNDQATFTKFSSSTLIADNVAAYGYLDTTLSTGSSKLCMGCHDGVTALGALSNETIIDIGPSNYLTATDLRNKHPVSFEYQDATGSNLLGALEGSPKAGDYGLPDGLGNGTIQNDFVAEKWRREGKRVECTICHDPHEDRGGDPANLPFWVSSSLTGYDSHDSVCRACHSLAAEYTFSGGYTGMP